MSNLYKNRKENFIMFLIKKKHSPSRRQLLREQANQSYIDQKARQHNKILSIYTTDNM